MSLRNLALGVLLENQTLERLTGNALDVVAVIRSSRGTWGPFWREAYDIGAAYRSWVEYESGIIGPPIDPVYWVGEKGVTQASDLEARPDGPGWKRLAKVDCGNQVG